MENIQNENIETPQEKEQTVDLRYLVDVAWGLKYWIILSVVGMLFLGWFYLQFTPPKYNRSAAVLIANDRTTGGAGLEMQLLSDITGMRANGLVHNEMSILTSRPLMQSVIEDLSLNVRYYLKEDFLGSTELYQNSPLSLTLVSGSTTNPTPYVMIDFQVSADTLSYTIRELHFVSVPEDSKHSERKEFRGKTYKFGDAVNLPDHNVVILSKSQFSDKLQPLRYKAAFSSPKSLAKQYAAKLVASTNDYKERSSVIKLTLQDNIARRADDILNTLILNYNKQTKDYLSMSTASTIEFIDERLTSLESQLGEIESDVRTYQSDNSLLDFKLQAESMIKKGTETENMLVQLGIQLQFLDMIREYLEGEADDYSLLPSNIGIEDQGLTSIINEYNSQVIERRRLMLGASETNPRIVALTSQIQDMRQAILLTVKQLRESYQYRYDTVLAEANKDRSMMEDIPNKRLDLAKIERQQMIVEPLYVLLSQKREEAMISLYAQTDNARVVEPADGPDRPSSPQPLIVLILCVIFGAVAPILVFFLKKALQTKVSDVADVQNRTSLSILGYIPASQTNSVVQAGSRDVLTETYRALKANMTFLPAKVIQVTSSVSGEGKSTVAVNLSLTLAFGGKKVLLIETDMRNGFDYRFFGLPKSSHGLSTYLSGMDELETVLHSGVVNENLDIILRGSTPPNPNELLSSQKMTDLIAQMRDKYDYIICDSAPYIIISDPVVVNTYMDATFYVVRCGYSDLRFIDEINYASSHKRLKNISIIINGLSQKMKLYGRYGGYGYGYGYGYGNQNKKKE